MMIRQPLQLHDLAGCSTSRLGPRTAEVLTGFQWLVPFLSLVILAGCGGQSSTTTTPLSPTPVGNARFAYVANFASGNGRTLSGYTVASTNGNLLSFDLSALVVPVGPAAIATDGSGRHVYVGSQGGLISAYSASVTTGALTELSGSPYGAGRGVTFLAIDSSGKYLFSADAASNTVWPFAIDAKSGALTAVASSPTTTSYGLTPAPPVSVTVDPFVRYVYVAMGDAGTEVFSINNGALVDVATVPPMPGLQSKFVAVERTGRFAYVADGVSGLAAYAINQSTGDLTLITGTPIPAGVNASYLVLTPDSKFLYVADLLGGTVSQFTLAADGTLTSIAAAEAAGSQPCAMTVDSTGTFLYVVNAGSNTVSIFRINPLTGALAAQAPATTGPSPSGIITTP